MASTDKELEKQLIEAGNKLINPPSSVDDLLPLLDQLGNCLSKVEQSPTPSMERAIHPSKNALVTDQLFRHSDMDVKVAVASCISEITRITAPDAPYDDDQMKDVFQLIVSSFENLDDQSGKSYGNRTSILETVAKVRSCVVMLDLECDALILEMFQHFLNAIRDYHPDNVFSSMETVMVLVLEESEDISVELLSPLLASTRRGNEGVLPIACKLAEKVLEGCATKVKPYLQHAVKSLGISLDDYSDVVGSICQEMSSTIEQNDHAAEENKVEESKPAGASTDEAVQAEIEVTPEAGSLKQADTVNDKSPKSVVSNGVAQDGEVDSLADSCALKKQDDGKYAHQPKGSTDMPSNDEPNVLNTERAVNEESKPEHAIKMEGRKVDSSKKLTEPSESSNNGDEKEAQELLDAKTPSKAIVPGSPHQEASADAAMSLENKKEADSSQPSSPKTQEGESMAVASPSGSGSRPDECLPKESGQLKKKDSLIKDLEPSTDDVPQKASEEIGDSEKKTSKRSARKAPARSSNEEKASTEIDVSKKESVQTTETEEKPVKQPSKRADSSSKNSDGSSLNQSEDKKQRSRGKSILEKNVTKILSEDDDKEKVSSPKSVAKSTKDVHQLEDTPKTDTKRKRAGSEKGSEPKDEDSLIGVRVKVWWPHDRAFYKGVIRSYDASKKKHEVFYDDGDIECLNLKRQKWERIEDEEEEADSQSPEITSEKSPKKKAKTNTDQSSKQGKVDSSPSRGGGGSSSKSKSAGTKSGKKLKDVGKIDSKSSNEPKVIKKTDDDSVGKTKENSNKSGSKTADAGPKASSKSKNVESSTSKTGKSNEDGSKTPKISKLNQETPKTGKTKQDAPKVTSNAKNKSPKSTGKPSVNGTGKLKSGSLKVKEIEDENSTDSGEPQDSAKGKSLSSSKRQGSEAKSGKKRRRV